MATSDPYAAFAQYEQGNSSSAAPASSQATDPYAQFSQFEEGASPASSASSNDSTPESNTAYASGIDNPKMAYHWQDEKGNEVFGANVPKNAKPIKHLNLGGQNNNAPVNPAEDFIADNPDYTNPVVGKTKMPDGSTYTGRPDQDALLHGLTSGIHGQQGNNAIAEMGRKTVEQGRGLKQAWLWLKQGGNHIQTASGTPQIGPELEAYNQQVAQQHQQDAPLANSVGGQVGGTAFNLTEGALLPGGLIKQAATQAGLGMLDPLDMQPGESFLGGKIMQGLKTGVGALAGGALPTAASKIIQPFTKEAGSEASHAPWWKMQPETELSGSAPALTQRDKDIATMSKNGIDILDAAQQTGNESANAWKRAIPPSPQFIQQQNAQATEAILARYGGRNEPETQTALVERQMWAQKQGNDFNPNGASPDVMGAIQDGANTELNNQFSNTKVHLTNVFNNRLAALRAQAVKTSTGGHDPDAFTSIIDTLTNSAKASTPNIKNIDNITTSPELRELYGVPPGYTNPNAPKFISKTGVSGTIDPDVFKAMYQRVSNLYGGDWAELGGQLKDAMNSAFAADNPQGYLKVLQLNQRLANMHRLEGAVDPISGTIPIQNLFKVMKKQDNKQATIYGSGPAQNQDLSRLALAATRTMTTPKSSSGTVGARLIGAGLTGLGIGAGEGLTTGDWKKAAELAVGGMAGGWAGNKLLYSAPGRALVRGSQSPIINQGIKALGRIGTAAGANKTQIPSMLNTEQQE